MSRVEQATFVVAVATAIMCVWFAPISALVVGPIMVLYALAAGKALRGGTL